METMKGGVSQGIENTVKPTRSMWTARSEKKAARLRHARNYQAGHIQIDEYHLHRTGIRGRKRWIVWSGLLVLLIIAVANLVLNCILIAVLQLSPSGLPYLVFQSQNRVLFPKTVNISGVEISHTLSGYRNQSLKLESQTFDFHAGIRRLDHSTSNILNSSQIQINSDNIAFKPYSQFKVVSYGGEDVMILNTSSGWIGPTITTSELHSDTIFTNLINSHHLKVNCSANGGNSTATTTSSCNVRTTESIVLTSANSVMVSSETGDIRIAMRQGGDLVLQGNSILLPTIPQYPGGTEATGTQLCICENGHVYRTIGISCLINPSFINPCRHT